MNWTEQEYADYLKRQRVKPKQTMTGLGRNRMLELLAEEHGGTKVQTRPSEPNKTEREAAAIYIEPRRLTGEVRRYRAHAITLLLADRLRYTPDWVIWLPGGLLEFMEVKGQGMNKKTGRPHVEDDAVAKFKMAVEQFPEHTFWWAHKLPAKAGGWKLVRHPARL